MKPLAIEEWALRILTALKRGERVEDSRVELKREWPDPKKVARRLAAHANASHGDGILWLIGVDEEDGVIGVKNHELSEWYPKVQSGFDGIAPTVWDVNVPFGDLSVVALYFDTSRAPYVVKNPDYGTSSGNISREVPWREGTQTRSARREDLVLLLASSVKIPKFEILEGTTTQKIAHNQPGRVILYFQAQIYVVPLSEGLLVFPFHMCTAEFFSKGEKLADSSSITFSSQRKRNADPFRRFFVSTTQMPRNEVNVQTGNEIIDVTSDEILIRGPGKFQVTSYGFTALPETEFEEIEIRIKLKEAKTAKEIILTVKSGARSISGAEISWKMA